MSYFPKNIEEMIALAESQGWDRSPSWLKGLYFLPKDCLVSEIVSVVNSDDAYKKQFDEYSPIEHCLYAYTRMVLGEPWPEIEPFLLKNPLAAIWYARYVLKKRWLEAEKVLLEQDDSDSDYEGVVEYITSFKKEPWPEIERKLMFKPSGAFCYAKYVLQKRWPPCEPFLLSEPWVKEAYEEHFKCEIPNLAERTEP